MKNELGNNPYFDPKMGILGAAIMGPVVYWLNRETGTDVTPVIYQIADNISLNGSTVAGLKQGAYTFLVAGTLARINQNLSTSIDYSKIKRITMGTLVPAIITSTLNYALHSTKGTPEPELSTLPTILSAFPGFLWLSIRNNKKLERILEEVTNSQLS